MKKILITLSLESFSIFNAQVLIDDSGSSNGQPDANAVLELRSADKAFLLPRLEQAPVNAPEGLVYYNTSTSKFMGYNGTHWVVLGTNTNSGYTLLIENATTVVEGEEQNFTVTISPAVSAGETIAVEYITQELTASATEDTDYVGSLGTLTFTANETSKTITIPTTDDAVVEETESYAVQLFDARFDSGAGVVNIAVDEATGSIEDNDTVSQNSEVLIEIPMARIQDDWDTYFSTTSGYVSNDYQGVRLASGSAGGIITYNDPIDFSGATGTVVITIDVKGWSSSENFGTINVGTESYDFNVNAVKEDTTAETVTYTFNNVPTGSSVSFESKGGDERFIIYRIKIEKQD